MVKSNATCELCAFDPVGLTDDEACFNILCGLSYNLVEDLEDFEDEERAEGEEEEGVWHVSCFWGNADEYALSSFTRKLAETACINAGLSADDVCSSEYEFAVEIPHSAGSSMTSLLNGLSIPCEIYYEGQEVPPRGNGPRVFI